MGIPDDSLQDLILRVRSWVSRRGSDLICLPDRRFEMPGTSEKICTQCDFTFTQFCHRYHCQSCGFVFCENCIWGFEYIFVARRRYPESGNTMKSCKLCSELDMMPEGEKKYSEKVHPFTSSPDSLESPSPYHSGEKLSFPDKGESGQIDHLAQYHEPEDHGDSLHAVTTSSMISFSPHTSSVSVCRSPSRSDEEDAEDSRKHFFSQSSQYSNNISDTDSNSVSARYEFYSFKSLGSSPSDCPSRISLDSDEVGNSVQQRQEGIPNSGNSLPSNQKTTTVLRSDTGTEDPQHIDDCSDCLSIFHEQYEKSQEPLDFDNNDLIWFPPPPDDEDDDAESNFFEFNDEDDNTGDSGAMFSSTSSLSNLFPTKERQNEGDKEPLKSVIQGHFRALVSQLLQGEGIRASKENNIEDWVDVVTVIAWQAASFVKPDTSKGGSMDPADYVKVKCIASGSPSDSTLIKGVVCTKNIKHKRMISHYKNPRLLILAGALEYQKVPNQLASIDALLHQENDHLKMIISKIEAFRPNVLLVEKSVSSCAQDYLLEKEISLVLNVKRPLLERIARCTGAQITPSIDNISTTRLGHCEHFRLERVSEEHEAASKFNKKPSKTLMFFEGCPRRLGCTILLRGRSRDELQKIKHVIQYAVFAARHLTLETSFLADEGASLPTTSLKSSLAISDSTTVNKAVSCFQSSSHGTSGIGFNASVQDEGSDCLHPDPGGLESSFEHQEPVQFSPSPPGAYNADLTSNLSLESCFNQCQDLKGHSLLPSSKSKIPQSEFCEHVELNELTKAERIDGITDTHQSILVSFSSRCVLKGTVCERSRLLRIKFYGCFDKPLGKYLRNDLFDQISCCQYCKEPAEAHVQCYTHQQGNLTISVKSLSSLKLPGERDGKIWMWHRCLRCAHVDGVPPATPRVVMSDAAWGLSFGKFLELSFSNHSTANRVATCGHSLQRDCLRYYGFGSMVAFFRYSHIDILSVQLPPSVLEFNGLVQQEWIRKEAVELMTKMETLYMEISDVLNMIEQKRKSFEHGVLDTTELQNHIVELKDLLVKERNDYNVLLQPVNMETSEPCQIAVDILELNRLRRSLQIGAHVWDRRLCSLDSLLTTDSISKATHAEASYALLKELRSDVFSKDAHMECGHDRIVSTSPRLLESPRSESHPEQEQETNVDPFEVCAPKDLTTTSSHHGIEEIHSDMEITVDNPESIASLTSDLSENIDSAWIGTDQPLVKILPPHTSEAGGLQVDVIKLDQDDNSRFRRLRSPVRVNSFDSAIRFHERTRKGLPFSSLHLSTLRSFHVSGDYWGTVRNPVSGVTRTYSQILPLEAQKMNLILGSTPFISTLSHVADGARLLLPQAGHNDLVIAVYDDEPTSVISYALSSKEYEDSVGEKSMDQRGWSASDCRKEDSAVPTFSAWQSFGSLDLDYIHYRNYGAEDASPSIGGLFMDSKISPHLRIAFEDESSSSGGKAKFSVTCYYAKEFDSLRAKCCPSEVDFVRSLSRSCKWNAQGGKSNVYFARSMDERFIIKQVTKTELGSFEDFAPEYFKYLTESLNSRSPTCLAKVLGIYQVTVKNLSGGREMKMDLMVMENLFYKRNISRVYDLKGSTRSRYNSDTTGENNVLLDMNLLESLRTKPIFLGSKAKRSLERAVWNDTSFLASVDVMDYSLLVGVDEERNELVLGIIDFMRQYTWDKHLETWVKASGILGGPKNTSPTIISPKQYKKRFRKAMTTYFLTVPDQWPS